MLSVAVLYGIFLFGVLFLTLHSYLEDSQEHVLEFLTLFVGLSR